jgi:hypothetical protein
LEQALNNCEGFAQTLGLESASDDLFIGRIQGFPVGLKFIDPRGAVLLLFQVRHWLPADAPQIKSLVYDEEVARLLAEKKIQIEFDDQIAWLTFVDLGPSVESEAVLRLLNSALRTFAVTGFIGDPDLCHYCRSEKVPALSSSDGKVAQICTGCLDARVKKHERTAAAPTDEAVPILLMTPFAALAGALLWMGYWIGYTLILGNFGSDTVIIPRLLLAIIVLLAGFLAGGPVGWIIRQNRRRGAATSTAAAIAFGALAVAFGEILFLAWLIWKWYGVFSISVATRVLPAYYGGNDPFFLAFKFVAALACVFVAYEMAKPERARLKL